MQSQSNNSSISLPKQESASVEPDSLLLSFFVHIAHGLQIRDIKYVYNMFLIYYSSIFIFPVNNNFRYNLKLNLKEDILFSLIQESISLKFS